MKPVLLLYRLLKASLTPTRERILTIARENGLIVLVIAVYSVAAILFKSPAISSAELNRAAYFDYLSSMIGIGVALLGMVYLKHLVCHLHAGFAGLSTATERIFNEYLRLDRLAGFLIVLGACPFFFSAYTTFKASLPHYLPFSWDSLWVQLDYLLHGNRHPWEWLQPLFSEPTMTVLLDKIYYHGWFMLWTLSLLWMAWSSERTVRQRFFITFLLTWIVCGSVLAYLFSSAGPCYLGNLDGQYAAYEELFLYLAEVQKGHQLYALEGQAMLWQSYLEGELVPGGGISAMPSMHLAMATLCALAAWRFSRTVGIVLTLFTAIILIGSVQLGWHYAIDGYASILLTIGLWKMTGRWFIKAETAGTDNDPKSP